jgi:hypothetical protein
LQASLRHVEQGASGVEVQRCRGEVAVLGDRLARAQAEAEACRRQLQDAEAGHLLLLSYTVYTGVHESLCDACPTKAQLSACPGWFTWRGVRAGLQAGHAAKEQQAADRLAAAQRDVGDLQVGQAQPYSDLQLTSWALEFETCCA